MSQETRVSCAICGDLFLTGSMAYQIGQRHVCLDHGVYTEASLQAALRARTEAEAPYVAEMAEEPKQPNPWLTKDGDLLTMRSRTPKTEPKSRARRQRVKVRNESEIEALVAAMSPPSGARNW